MKQWVYNFSTSSSDGDQSQRNLLGGKGANLAQMCLLGLPVPPGFTITTEACLNYYQQYKKISQALEQEILEAIKKVATLTQKEFGSSHNPLLFSVRSGARVSMPGMMDTVLNLGLNDSSVEGLSALTQNPRFAWDSYRRFIQMYANVVLGVNASFLESVLEDLKESRGFEEDTELQTADLQELVRVFKRLLLEEHNLVFPQDPMEQLWGAIGAVFDSWNTSRAQRYRELNQIPHDWGTAVNVQSMVFGNLGDDSGTGVCFTRNPSTGEKYFFGEYLMNAQGEDVVAGVRTPAPINQASQNDSQKKLPTLEEVSPNCYAQLVKMVQKLEEHYRDMQDIEFTIEKGELFLLQTRSGKRTTRAALKIMVDMVAEGLLNQREALMRLKPEDLNQLLHPRLDPAADTTLLAQGLPASPGAAGGAIVFDSEEAHALNEGGKKVLLVRQETSPEDIAGMAAAQGILTARGGMTSHAAVVARGMGKPCVAGCSGLIIDEKNKVLKVGGQSFQAGDWITIDGGTGKVLEGRVPTIEPEISGDFETLMSWADEVRELRVRTNADNPQDTAMALKFGAEGIGLCRTEHMFFDPERILAVRKMIFAQNTSERETALMEIFPFQRQDFIQLFELMDAKPVNIRLLDPPLHEFLPHHDNDIESLARALSLGTQVIRDRIQQLQEYNPMLGHRGCRLGISYPEIYLMQARAILEAAHEVAKKGIQVAPEIMIPLVVDARELQLIRGPIESLAKELQEGTGQELKYKIGTMIELPRAALTAQEIAPHADFFSFGTNDLTQTTYGLSRDDAGKFLPQYLGQGIFPQDPFVSLDVSGVGSLIQTAVEQARRVSSLHIGICGEHGGDPASIDFCQKQRLDYVSCSPFRVPIARLAAAQAVLKASEG